MNDLLFRNHGSIWLLVPVTAVGQEWIDEHITEDAPTWCGGVAVEPRYVADIMSGATDDGLAMHLEQ